MTLFAIDTGLVHWTAVRPWLEDACETCDGWWTVNALEDLLNEGKALLWVLSEGSTPIAGVVTAIADWDGKKVAEIIVAGGSGVLDGLAEHFDKVHVWARAQNADEVVFRGRRGWARALKSHGYEEIAVTLRKAL